MAKAKYVKIMSAAADEPFFALKVGEDTSMFKEGDIVCLCCGGLTEHDDVLMMEEIPEGSKMLYSQDNGLIYLFYVHEWIKDHGYTVKDFFEQAQETRGTAGEVIIQFEEQGFNGELYVCYNEFLDDYLGDPEYALHMLNQYVNYITGEEEENNND